MTAKKPPAVFVGVATFENLADEWSAPMTIVTQPQRSWEDARRLIVAKTVNRLNTGALEVANRGEKGMTTMIEAAGRINDYMSSAQYTFTVMDHPSVYRVRVSVGDVRD